MAELMAEEKKKVGFLGMIIIFHLSKKKDQPKKIKICQFPPNSGSPVPPTPIIERRINTNSLLYIK
jgi:hypothetical protein